MKIFYTVIIFFSFFVHGKESEFKLHGKYQIKSVQKAPISFVLTWSEKEGRVVNGRYSDDFFTQGAFVTGSAGHLGRNFLVRFPAIIHGVRTVSIIAPQTDEDGTGLIPVTIVSKDNIGTPLETNTVSAELEGPVPTPPSQLTAQVEREEAADECIEGFGVMAGFCGIYRGEISEDVDPMKRCNLNDNDDVRLELDLGRNLKLYFNNTDGSKPHYSFHIGQLRPDPKNRTIEVKKRLCGQLPDTNFPEGNCKTLTLSGTFSAGVTDLQFLGSLSVFDETTLNMCKYSFSMERQI